MQKQTQEHGGRKQTRVTNSHGRGEASNSVDTLRPGDEYAPYTARLDNPFLDDMYIETGVYDYKGEPGYFASEAGRNRNSIEQNEGVLKKVRRFLGLGPKPRSK